MSQLYSYSRIGCFTTCPLQYAHRYIHKTPSPLPEGVELFMGSRFHEAMEYLYKQVPTRVPSLGDVLQCFDQSWDSNWKALLFKQKQKGFATPIRISKEGESIGDYQERARMYVENYYRKYQPFDQDQTEAGGIEKRVVFNLDPDGQYRMQGYIDRVARTPDGTLWVHDYKTGSRKHNPGDCDKEDQLSLYQVGLLQDPKYQGADIRLKWHYVAFEDDVMETRRDPGQLDNLKNRYIQKIRTIENATAFEPQTSALCGWCEFLPLCPKGQAEVERRRKKKEGDEPSFSTAAPLPAAFSSKAVTRPVKDALATAVESPIPTVETAPVEKPVTAPLFNAVSKPRSNGKGRKNNDSEPTPQLPLF